MRTNTPCLLDLASDLPLTSLWLSALRPSAVPAEGGWGPTGEIEIRRTGRGRRAHGGGKGWRCAAESFADRAIADRVAVAEVVVAHVAVIVE